MFSLLPTSNPHAGSPSQKICQKCHFVLDVSVSRCFGCGHTPWAWRSNVRMLVVFMLLAVPCLLHETRAYHTGRDLPSPDDGTLL